MVVTNLGHILANTKIAVDWWESDFTPLVDFYFCSHVISDHISGLSKSWSRPIYCSEISGKLLTHTRKVPESLIKTLQYNTATRLGDSFTVTMLDANHSMGSVMFLFEGEFGRILYTGNFRWCPTLTTSLQNLTIDTVYFDNTYSRKAAKFMTRVECKDHATELCRSQISQNRIVYFVLDPIGKEDILSHVAETLKIQVVVSEDKYQLIQCMGLSNHFTTDKKDGSVFCLSKTKFNYKKAVAGITEQHSPSQVVFVKISGMRRGQNCLSYEYIKYSDHSSMKEIELFFASLCYKSACPIMTKTERDKSVSSAAKEKQTKKSEEKTQQDPDRLKVKLRKNKEEQTSFSITSEFENTPGVSYRVVTGVTTDEEVGDSPEQSIFSPCSYPGRTCSTPIPNINDEILQELAIYHDQSSGDSNPSSEFPYSYVSGSPDRLPYIEPPIPLDWLPSPIRSDHNDPILSDIDANDFGGLCSLGDEMSPDVHDETSAKVSRSSHAITSTVSPKFIFPHCSMQLNSPVYNVNGKVSYPPLSIAKEEQKILSGGCLPIESHRSNVSMIYDEMFKEVEVPKEISDSLGDDFSDGIEVLNETPDSVETLYVSDTESESEDDIEKAGPIGDYLRGQYALNQMFNSTVINIRETFNPAVFNPDLYKRKRKVTEDDLASTRVQLLLPKVVCSPEVKAKQGEKLESEAVRQALSFRESKDVYFRQLSEITKKCQNVTYNKKPRKIGKSLPVSRVLLSDSINLLNNYADGTDPRLRDLAWKLTVDKIAPKNLPVLQIKKHPLSPEMKKEVLLLPKKSPLSPKMKKELFIPKERPISPDVLIIPDKQSSIPIHPTYLVESKKTVCIPRLAATPKPSKALKSTPKSSLSANQHSPAVDENSRKKKKRVIKPAISTPKQSPQSENIFDMLFGSTPTSMATKRMKKRPKEQVSRKRINISENGICDRKSSLMS